MGVDTALALQLLETRHLVADKTAGVMLGRQGLRLKPRWRTITRRALARHGFPTDIPAYEQEDGYAEKFLCDIGFPPMKSMDFSDYEGCDFTHDMNEAVPDALRKRFDVILDGGTLEHVFNTPQSLDNVFHMLKDDGIFISINGMSGWAGHGFYQFSPELVWRYWQDTRGCKVHSCAAVPFDPTQNVIQVADTGKKGARFRARGLDGRWYLYYVVQKTKGANPAEHIQNAQQGDYVVRWNNA
ncbi:class I SAM-dependent methyltransferase [Yoonia sp. I 8.24]|uniref:class I SAM-dependent methyltransferase n=1 Tax=Yoonia sp. I 8.24 TaxID=1537229 RepID=UPI001EE00079|nr:hypothetical protein [Yoonia sp. I 8.24]MCG3266161.1 hypothetical protein [Yoonia sp. I 8.24]